MGTKTLLKFYSIIIVGLLILLPVNDASAQDTKWCYELSVVAGANFGPSPQAGNIERYTFTPGVGGSLQSFSFFFYPVGTTVTDYVLAGVGEGVGLASATMVAGGSDGTVFTFGGGNARVVDLSLCAGAIRDGRVNASDLAALAAVYPTSEGFEVWAINPQNGQGSFVFTVSRQQINEARLLSESADENQLVASNEDETIFVYLLASGECQLNYFSRDGQMRDFRFNCG